MKKLTIILLALVFLTCNVNAQFRSSSGTYPYQTSMEHADVFLTGRPGETNYNVAASNALNLIISVAPSTISQTAPINITGSATTATNAITATNSPSNGLVAGTNAPSLYGPVRVSMPVSIYGANTDVLALGGTTGTANLDIYQSVLRVLMPSSGIAFKNLAGSSNYAIVTASGITANSDITANRHFYGNGSLMRGILGHNDYAQVKAMPVPALGFNLWWLAGVTNSGYGTNISEATVLTIATNAVNNGMVAAGWKGFYLDGGHWLNTRTTGQLTCNSNLFPSGLNYLTTTLKQLGFNRVGTYTSYGTGNCGSPTVGTTTFGLEKRDVHWFANHGFNALKVDACYPVASPSGFEGPYFGFLAAGTFAQAINELVSGGTYMSIYEPLGTNMQVMQLVLSFNQSNYDPLTDRTRGTASPAILAGVNVLEESQLSSFGQFNQQFTNAYPRLREQQHVRPGHYTEFSESCAAVFYSTNTFKGNLAIHAMLSSPIYCSWNPNWDVGGYNIWATNATFIAIHQDIGVYPCEVIQSNVNYQTWRKPIAGTTDQTKVRKQAGYAFGLANLSEATNQTFTLTAEQCGIPTGEPFLVRDGWNNVNLGPYQDSFSYEVATNTMALLTVIPFRRVDYVATETIQTTGNRATMSIPSPGAPLHWFSGIGFAGTTAYKLVLNGIPPWATNFYMIADGYATVNQTWTNTAYIDYTSKDATSYVRVGISNQVVTLAANAITPWVFHSTWPLTNAPKFVGIDVLAGTNEAPRFFSPSWKFCYQ